MMQKKDLAKVTGIKPRTVLDWTTRGYLQPAVPSQGQGTNPLYDRLSIVQALVLKALSERGVSLAKFSQALHHRKPVNVLFNISACMATIQAAAAKKGTTIEEQQKTIKTDLIIFDDCRRVVIDMFDTERMHPEAESMVVEKFSEDFETKLTIRLNSMISVALRHDM